jgi:hypothetical protein
VSNDDRRAFTNSTVNTEQLLADPPDALFTERPGDFVPMITLRQPAHLAVQDEEIHHK